MTLFEKIVAGEIPSHKVYEDDRVYAFLDIGPLSRGHCLLIPKTPYVTLDEVEAEDAAALGRALPRLIKAVKTVTGASAANVLQNNGELAGQEVMHVHFHIIPKTAERGLRKDWQPGALDDDATELAQAIGDAMAG